MIKKKSTEKKKQPVKKTASSEIIPVLTSALLSLKEKLGEKKFEKRIKKAAKMMTSGIKSVSSKIPVAKKKASRKVVAKKATGVPVKKVTESAKKK